LKVPNRRGLATTRGGVPIKASELAWVYLALVPFVILFVALTIWPLVRTVEFSLYRYNGVGSLDTAPYVGLDNYGTILSDGLFLKSYGNTWVFTIGQTLIKLPLSFLIALLLTQRWLKLRVLFRTVFFLPWLMPASIVAMVFYYLLNPANGAVNEFLQAVHLTQEPIDFFASGPIAFATIAIISVWQIMGQYVIFWMAALLLVPQHLYDAADVDGAGGWQKIRYITLPIIKPIAVIIASLGIIWSLGIFDWVQILTSGGPGTDTYVVNYYVYEKAFARVPAKYGVASAAGVLFGITVLVVYVVIGRLVTRAQAKRREYGV